MKAANDGVSNAHDVFLSYSHRDLAIVQLFSNVSWALDRLPFVDFKSIQPGREWRVEIDEAIAGCTIVLLFWCKHSSHSEEVEKEWQSALRHNKRLVTILLDGTSLPLPLQELQIIDARKHLQFRHLVQGPVRYVVGGCLFLLCLLVTILLLVFYTHGTLVTQAVGALVITHPFWSTLIVGVVFVAAWRLAKPLGLWNSDS